MPKAKRYDRVVLLESVDDFPKDAWGAVVEVYTKPYEAYDIEIMTDDGRTMGLVDAVLPEQFEVKKNDSIPSAVHFQSIQLREDRSHAVILFSNGTRLTVSADELYTKLDAK
ncbi:MAG: DUF4926 domain-containing protein [Deltaproteobacteria bacterium]|nr:DUF4926 domain-containing protein [Deltaproteobacteria bacterium]